METGLEGGEAFGLAVLIDGTADVYFSKGGGVVGAGKNIQVQRAASAMLLLASRMSPQANRTTETPMPRLDQVTFYFLSRRGTLAYTASVLELREGKDRMSRLYYAGQQVLSAVSAAAPKALVR